MVSTIDFTHLSHKSLDFSTVWSGLLELLSKLKRELHGFQGSGGLNGPLAVGLADLKANRNTTDCLATNSGS